MLINHFPWRFVSKQCNMTVKLYNTEDLLLEKDCSFFSKKGDAKFFDNTTIQVVPNVTILIVYIYVASNIMFPTGFITFILGSISSFFLFGDLCPVRKSGF